LFGIFGIHIPPLYGEGADRAWERLNDEIKRAERKKKEKEVAERRSNPGESLVSTLKYGLKLTARLGSTLFGLRSKTFMVISLLVPVVLWIAQIRLIGRILETSGAITLQPWSGLDPTLPIFAIIGKTGVGKSSFINELKGRNASGKAPDICHGLDSCKSSLKTKLAEVNLTDQ
jgi:hypothetical protein